MVADMKKLWTGVCSIIQLKAIENLESGRMEKSEEVIFDAVPCLLISSTKSATRGNVSEVYSSATLIIDSSVQVPEGSKITVCQNGYTADYAFSGIPKVYRSHKEIPLTLFRRWA